MAAKLEQRLGVKPILVPEGRGIFDVAVDGIIKYSKFETGTFPNEDELVDDLVSELGG